MGRFSRLTPKDITSHFKEVIDSKWFGADDVSKLRGEMADIIRTLANDEGHLAEMSQPIDEAAFWQHITGSYNRAGGLEGQVAQTERAEEETATGQQEKEEKEAGGLALARSNGATAEWKDVGSSDSEPSRFNKRGALGTDGKRLKEADASSGSVEASADGESPSTTLPNHHEADDDTSAPGDGAAMSASVGTGTKGTHSSVADCHKDSDSDMSISENKENSRPASMMSEGSEDGPAEKSSQVRGSEEACFLKGFDAELWGGVEHSRGALPWKHQGMSQDSDSPDVVAVEGPSNRGANTTIAAAADSTVKGKVRLHCGGFYPLRSRQLRLLSHRKQFC